MKIFESVADLSLAVLKVGEIVRTKAYYNQTPYTGGAVYRVVDLATFSGTPDEIGLGFTLANGNVAELQHDGILYSDKFGLSIDPTNPTVDRAPNIQAMLDAASDVASDGVLAEVHIKANTYNIHQPLLISSNTKLVLAKETFIRKAAAMDNMIRNKSDGISANFSANNNITIQGGRLDPNKISFPADSTAIAFGHCTNIIIDGIRIDDNPGIGQAVNLTAVDIVTIKNCWFRNGGNDNAFGEAIKVGIAASSSSFPWFGPYDDVPCRSVNIRDNLISGWALGIASHISVLGVKNFFVNIVGNEILVGRTGIKARSWSGTKIVDNRITCSLGAVGGITPSVGIEIISSSNLNGDFSIANNTINAFTRGDPGVASHALKIIADVNYINQLKQVRLSNNFFFGAQQDVCKISYVEDLTFVGNTVGNGAVGWNGLLVTGCKQATVTSNVFQDDIAFNGTTGVSSNITFNDNVVLGDMGLGTLSSNAIWTGNTVATTSGTVHAASARKNNIIGGVYVA